MSGAIASAAVGRAADWAVRPGARAVENLPDQLQQRLLGQRVDQPARLFLRGVRHPARSLSCGVRTSLRAGRRFSLAAAGVAVTLSSPIAAEASGFAAAFLAATTDGCLAALERGAEVDGAALGLSPAPARVLPYRAPGTVWQEPAGRFALGTATLPGGALAGTEARRLCEAESLVYLRAETVNATYAGFLDWAEAAREAGRYRFLGTRRNDDWLTGLASLASTAPNPRGYALEVTFTAQPAEGRVAFSAQELRPEVLK